MKARIAAIVAGIMLIVGMPISANAATHYKTPPSHDKFTTQADKEHIVSVVINCFDGEVESDCLNPHYSAYFELVYLWTSNNKSVAEGGCGYGGNHALDYENDAPHTRYVYNKKGELVNVLPPKPGKLTKNDLRKIWLSAFCYGITTDTSMSNEKEADEIFDAEWNGIIRRLYTAVP